MTTPTADLIRRFHATIKEFRNRIQNRPPGEFTPDQATYFAQRSKVIADDILNFSDQIRSLGPNPDPVPEQLERLNQTLHALTTNLDQLGTWLNETSRP
jgi:hypothetical protein